MHGDPAAIRGLPVRTEGLTDQVRVDQVAHALRQHADAGQGRLDQIAAAQRWFNDRVDSARSWLAQAAGTADPFGSRLRVIQVEGPDGPAFIVQAPGTQEWSPRTGPNPSDLTTTWRWRPITTPCSWWQLPMP